MTWLINPTEQVAHRCDPPGQQSAIASLGDPGVQHRTTSVHGALWQCDCGQHFHGVGLAWHPVTPRQARRLIHRHQKAPQ